MSMKDVARHAGVSVATVSHVLNDTRRVAPATHARVLAAIEQLGYESNMLARGLRTKRTMIIGLLVSDIQNPFFTSAVRGVEDAALPRGYHVVLCNTDEDLQREDEYLRELRKRQVDGLILASSAPRLQPVHQPWSFDRPVVFMDREVAGVQGGSIRVDNVKGMHLAAEHLVQLGHSRIAMVSGPLDKISGYERYHGLRKALADLGLNLDDELVRFGDFRLDGGKRAAADLFAVSPPPTAVVVANNLMTLGCLLALRELGWQVPRDISVLGFDDMDWAPLMNPPLTTIKQPTYQMGEEAVEMLFEQMRGEEPRHVFLDPRLIVRQSTAPPGTASSP